jgi:hypothetical protein
VKDAGLSSLLKRPVPVFDPSKGLLHNEHFQIAYVTNDIDRAVEVFQRRFGVPRFRESDAELPSGATIQVRAAWLGGVLYEITCGKGPGMELWACGAPSTSFVLRHHHFGFLVPDEDAWEALGREIARGGWTVLQRSDHPGIGRIVCVASPELGHCLEYIQPGPELLARFEATPAG